jgi:phage tail sheath gpL-like
MPANKKGSASRRYLEALDAHKPKRGRKRTPESIEKQLKAIEGKAANADPLARLTLVQQRMDLLNDLGSLQAGVDLSGLEADFVKVAKEYSQRKGISYAAWREVGVEPAVLKKAGVSRAAR